MNTLPSFFKTLWYSCTSLPFYKQVLRTPLKSSWWFFVRVYVFFALVGALLISVPLLIFDPDPAITDAFNTLYSMYPDELEIRLENGSYAINQELPYAVPMPALWQETDFGKRRIDHRYDSLVVFTTDEAIGTDVKNLLMWRSPVVVTESRLYVLTNERKEFYTISELLDDVEEPVVISEQRIRSFPPTMLTESMWLSRSFYVPVIAVTFFVVSSFVLLAWNALKAIVFALLAYLLFKLILHKRGLEFDDMLQISLHALVPVFILRSVLQFGLLPLGGLFWFGVYLVVVGFIHHMLLQKQTVKSAEVAKSSNVKTGTHSMATLAARKPTTKAPAKKRTTTKVKPKAKAKAKSPTKKSTTPKKSTTKKTTTKTTAKKKAAPKKTTNKSSATKASKATTTKKSASKKKAAKPATKKSVAKKTTTKTTAQKKAAPKKATSKKKTVAKKSTTKKK